MDNRNKNKKKNRVEIFRGSKDGKLRLQVYLSRSGLASRRKCEEYIRRGLIRVNGQVIREMGVKVGPEDIVQYRNRRIYPVKRFLYIALHKPPKYLSTTYDPDGRPIALNLITPFLKSRLYPVGRLDYLSSGLLFFTNDGEFARLVSHPSSGIEKEYVVETKKDIPLEFLEEYKKGIYVEGEIYKLHSYVVKGPRMVHIVLVEGKNREIRKVFGSRGLYPKRVHRIRIGSVLLKGLEAGKFRFLTEREVASFKRQHSEVSSW
ncbi:MAG: rRNA pseudouridine synthase [Spirochaetes bacterium]|nr:rRNA pseudouridine synthase [Spirochaetota bacterium]